MTPSTLHPQNHRLAPLRTAAAATAEGEEEDMAVHAAADKSVAQMFSKPLRVGLLVEPTVRVCVHTQGIWADSSIFADSSMRRPPQSTYMYI